MRFHVNPPQLAVAMFPIAVSAILGWGAFHFPQDKGYNALGPHVFPYAVSVFLALVGILLAWQAITGGFRGLEIEQTESGQSMGRRGAFWVSIGIVLISALITILGFALSAGLLFMCAARGFGSRRPLHDLAIGISLTLPVYWAFTSGLGVSLPSLINHWI